MTDRRPDTTHTVRPRWTWIAFVALVVAMVVIAVGNLESSMVLTLVGIVLLAVAGAAALYGGFFYDVKGGSSVPAQLSDLKEGNEHEFPGADTIRHEGEVTRDVRRRWLRNS